MVCIIKIDCTKLSKSIIILYKVGSNYTLATNLIIVELYKMYKKEFL